MTNYVVKDGAGFIGSTLVRALLAKGDGQVRVIYNLVSCHEKNLEEVRSRITFIRCDIRD
jgi:nucleoside-diphosphate-sugar epimerase